MGSSAGVGGGGITWEATTPSAETCSGLVPCSLFRIWHKPRASLCRERRAKGLKKNHIWLLIPSEAFVGAGGRWVPSAGWALPKVSGFSQDGKAKILSLPAGGGEGNLPCPDLLVSTWPCIPRSWLSTVQANPCFVSGFVGWRKLGSCSASEIPPLLWC